MDSSFRVPGEHLLSSSGGVRRLGERTSARQEGSNMGGPRKEHLRGPASVCQPRMTNGAVTTKATNTAVNAAVSRTCVTVRAVFPADLPGR